MQDVTTSPANSSAPPELWIDRLFLRLGAIYGSLWYQRWTQSPVELVKAEWSQELKFYDLQVIKRALDRCRSHQELPPTLPEFSRICRDCRTRPEAEPLNVPRLSFDRKEAKVSLDRLKAGVPIEKKEYDPLNCFREILAGAEAGTYTNHYGIRMAKEALGIDRAN